MKKAIASIALGAASLGLVAVTACGGDGSSGKSVSAACQKATDASSASVPSPDLNARDQVQAYSDALNAADTRLEKQIPSVVAAFKDAPARLRRDAERLVDSTDGGEAVRL